MVTIVAKDADFSSNFVTFSPPVAGAVYWNFFGGDATRTGRNLIPGQAAGAVVGSPIVGAGFTTFTGTSAYVRTGVLDLAAPSLLVVARPSVPASALYKSVISSSSGAGALTGTILCFDNTANDVPTAFVTRNNNGTDTAYTLKATKTPVAPATKYPNDPSAWRFLHGRGNGVDDITENATISGGALPRSTPNGMPYCVGSNNVGGAAGQSDIAFAAIYPTELSAAQVQTLYAAVQTYMAALGITI